MLSTRPLDGPFGIEVSGIDVGAGLDDADQRRLVDALHEHRAIVIRGQSLSAEQYLAFGALWGRPHPHVLDHLRMPGYPGMMAIGNTEAKDRDDDIRNGAAFWHTDQSYEPEPASATMLYCIKAPATGGETLIADMVAAYQALDAETRDGIEGLEAVHLYGAASGRDGENIAAPIINEKQADQVPPVRHPIARPHPVTGRKALYAVAGTPYAIGGMAEDEALALLARLKQHALQDRFVYKHKYRVGDVAIWDTSLTLHSGIKIAPATGESDSRLLWRISVKGKPPICG